MNIPKIQQYGYIAICILCGSLLLYRGLLGDEQLVRITDRIQAKEVVQTSSKGSGRYALALRLRDSKQVIGLYLGTLQQVQHDELTHLLSLNKSYQFYVDPSVAAQGEVTLGIRKITEGSRVIYAESNTFNLYAGSFFYLVGAVAIAVMSRQHRLQKKRKKKR